MGADDLPLRNIPQEDRALRQGRWQTKIGFGVKGKTLGIIGLGRLGSLVAGYGKAFGMEASAGAAASTPKKPPPSASRTSPRTNSFRSRISSRSTSRSATARRAGRRRRSRADEADSYLINTSRAPIVDEAALLAALKGRKIAGAAIDVFENEPITKGHPFFELDNVVVTPHLGYAIEDNFRVNYGSAVENIRAFLDGKPVRQIKPRT